MAVPFLRREPREYVSILKGVAGGAETAPALATILHGTTSRSSNPHCNPNEYRSPFPSSRRVGYPPRPTLIPLSLPPGYLVLPPSQHGSRFRPIKTLYDHVVPAQRPPLRLPLRALLVPSRPPCLSFSSYVLPLFVVLLLPASPFSLHVLVSSLGFSSVLSFFSSLLLRLVFRDTRVRHHAKDFWTSCLDGAERKDGRITMTRFEILGCRYAKEQVSRFYIS